MTLPRYVNFLTCFKFSPLMFIGILGFLINIHFFSFADIYYEAYLFVKMDEPIGFILKLFMAVGHDSKIISKVQVF